MRKKSHIAKSNDVDSVILDSIADGVFTVDENWIIQSFNRAAEEITGISKKEAIGQRCCDVFKASICETNCALRETIETGEQIIGKTIYIVDADGQKIPVSISTAILRNEKGKVIGGVETFRDLSIVEELKRKIESKYSLGDIISRNHRIQQIFDVIPEIAASNSTVLIVGESGTGKELFARAIHDLGPRRDKPFVAVNCGALPDTLLESELFGYKKGAFTDAYKDKPGRFTVAEKGTLFLDEIGDISPAMQVRLLRVLQEKVYEPLGSTKPVKTDVRIITATNQNLSELVETGKFRKDLFYRINIIKLALPSLRERKEDIPLLVNHFVTKYNRLQEKNVAGISDKAMSVLMAFDYPGNIRELENFIEHAFVVCHSGMIEVKHLPDSVVEYASSKHLNRKKSLSIDEMEIELIRDSLMRNAADVQKTADELGIHRATLYRKIKRYKIDLSNQD